MARSSVKAQLEAALERIRELETGLEAGTDCCKPVRDLQHLVFENAPGGMAIINADGRILAGNREAARLVGLSKSEVVGTTTERFYRKQEERRFLRNELLSGKTITNHELALVAADGVERWVNLNGKPFEYHGEKAVLITLADITEYHRAIERLQLDEIRFETLYTISEMINRPESDILNFALDAITKVSSSRIGYIYFLNEDETELILYAWSRDVMAQCTVQSPKTVYKVEDTGLWGDAVRQRKPVITNDYPNSPGRRGYPEGHVHIANHLNIPVFDGDRIVLLAGVANKDGDYTEEDVRQLVLVMNGTWRIIQRKRSEDALMAAHDELEGKVEQRTAELEAANEELAILNMQLVKKDQEREHALSALEESEHRFRSLFENSHAVMLLIDPDTGAFIDVNPAAAHFYGYSTDELRSMRVPDINILDEAEIKLQMKIAAKEARSFFSFRHRLASGEIRDVEVFSGPVLINGKNCLYSIIHDVTERKRAEEALVRYERIISTTPDLISLVDTRYLYRMVNDAYLRTFGKERDELVNHHISLVVGKAFFESTVKERLDRAFAGEVFTMENWMDIPGGGRLYLATTYHPVSIDGDAIDFVSVESRNMTDLKLKEEALHAAAERLDMATTAGNIGIWEWDLVADDTIRDKKMFELYGVRPGEFPSIYDAWRTRLHAEDLPEIERILADCIEKKTPYDAEFRIVLPDGENRCIRAAGVVQVDDSGMPIRMTGVNWDVTDQRRMENELRKLASTDPLTGASNRRHFMDRLEEELKRCKRYKTSMVLLSLDIDHFKVINDTHGHPSGDDVLKDLVGLCTRTLRTTDLFGRVGGEEFLAALTQASITAGQRTAERIRQIVESHAVKTHDRTISYTISIGLTELRADDTSIEDLLRRADEALYKAKNGGRNRVEVL